MTTSRARHCGSFWFYWTVTGTAEACGPGTRRAAGLVPHAPSRAPAAERKGPQVCKGGFAVPQRGVTSDRSNGTGAAADADHCGRGAPAPVSPRFRAALSARCGGDAGWTGPSTRPGGIGMPRGRKGPEARWRRATVPPSGEVSSAMGHGCWSQRELTFLVT